MHFYSHIVFSNRDEFTCKIIPDKMIMWDTFKNDADPIIVRGEEDWEKGIGIAVTLLINLVVYFVGRIIKKRKKYIIVLTYRKDSFGERNELD